MKLPSNITDEIHETGLYDSRLGCVTPRASAHELRGNSTAVFGASTTDLIRLIAATYRASTLRTYSGALVAFAAFVGRPNGAEALDWLLSIGPVEAAVVVGRWDAVMRDAGLAAATRAVRIAALRAVWSLAMKVGLATFPLMARGPTPTPLRDTRGPGVVGVRRMGEVAAARRVPRDVVLIGLLAACALRRSEVLACDVDDFDRAAARLRVTGKGHDDTVWIALPPGVMEALCRYLDARGAVPGQPLIVTMDRRARGQPHRLTGSGLDDIVRRLGVQAGLDRPVSAHRLRHTGVTVALDETDGNVRRVQRFSRHRKIETVLLYDDRRADAAGEVAAMVEAAIGAEALGGAVTARGPSDGRVGHSAVSSDAAPRPQRRRTGMVAKMGVSVTKRVNSRTKGSPR